MQRVFVTCGFVGVEEVPSTSVVAHCYGTIGNRVGRVGHNVMLCSVSCSGLKGREAAPRSIWAVWAVAKRHLLSQMSPVRLGTETYLDKHLAFENEWT